MIHTPCEPLLQKFGSQVSFKKSQSMPTLYFEYELNKKVKCSICGLPFDSTIDNPDRCSEIRCSEDDLLAPKQRAAKSIEQDSDS